MTATQLQAGQKLNCSGICNAESASELQASRNISVSLSMIAQIIDGERAKVLELRTRMGLHRLETIKTRWEKWDITAAKLMMLETIRTALDSLAIAPPGNLTGKKPSSLEFLEYCQRMFGFHSDEARAFDAVAMDAARRYHLDCREIYRNLLSKFSGSAEEQPLTSEEAPEQMGTAPVTVPEPNLSPATGSPLFSAVSPGSLEDLPTAELQTASEAILDELERRGVVVHWSLTGA